MHGLTEVLRSSPTHSPVKGFAYIGALQPELDIIGLVGHRVLCKWVSLEYFIGGEDKTHPDRSQKKTDGSEGHGGWRRARDILREIHSYDGGI